MLLKKIWIVWLLFAGITSALRAEAPDSLIVRANLFYANKMYEDAAALYQQVADSGLVASDLYYNLGNAYFKSHDIAHAILNYERALLLDPGNEDIRFNLELARTYVTDKIDVLPSFFLVQWYHWFLERFSTDTWAKISLAAFVIALFLLSLFLYGHRIALRRSGFISGIIILAFSLLALFFALESRKMLTAHDHAIVVQPSVTVTSAPDESGTVLFVIHEGTKVKVDESLDNWYEIRLSDGSKGWLIKKAVEII
ncbi:MAG: tetratricopeptide repeat protein [Chlorobi bacterium]|nr:tetratricopeptide repeat protein [Chlorobiota bacterium]